MKNLWRRFLCRIGRHEWITVRFVFDGWAECVYCWKRSTPRRLRRNAEADRG